MKPTDWTIWNIIGTLVWVLLIYVLCKVLSKTGQDEVAVPQEVLDYEAESDEFDYTTAAENYRSHRDAFNDELFEDVEDARPDLGYARFNGERK
jgi:hypothetical protein